MDETQEGNEGENEGGSRGQWMKHKEGAQGAIMDETQGGNEGGSRGQWMKHKGGNEGGSRGNG